MKIENKIDMYLKKMNEESYEEYFKKMLDKFGVSDPGELDDDKKKEFFAAVDAGYKSKDEKE